jgi:hypothetical protein
MIELLVNYNYDIISQTVENCYDMLTICLAELK